jgi:hypothetical protein
MVVSELVAAAGGEDAQATDGPLQEDETAGDGRRCRS